MKASGGPGSAPGCGWQLTLQVCDCLEAPITTLRLFLSVYLTELMDCSSMIMCEFVLILFILFLYAGCGEAPQGTQSPCPPRPLPMRQVASSIDAIAPS